MSAQFALRETSLTGETMSKARAPRNGTLSLTKADRANLRGRLVSPDALPHQLEDKTILGDSLEVAKNLPRAFADLLFLDPPYNLKKRFGDTTFERRPVDDYADWLGQALDLLLPTVKRTGTVLHLRRLAHFKFDLHGGRDATEGPQPHHLGAREGTRRQNQLEEFQRRCLVLHRVGRLCFQRRRGEDPAQGHRALSQRRRVARDWAETDDGGFRDTHPSNLWTDITVPFWSMPENTDHPTQKSEKFMAKLILASTQAGRARVRSVPRRRHLVRRCPELGPRIFWVLGGFEACALLAEKRPAAAAAIAQFRLRRCRVFWSATRLHCGERSRPRLLCLRTAGAMAQARLF